MSNRRMFSNRIANSAKFLQMPSDSQLLYFHMILRADDDGIVEAYPLLQLLKTQPDSFKILLAKGFVEQLNDDQVVVVVDWLEHNTIRADRKVDSIYKNLLKDRRPDIKLIEPKPRSDVEDNSRRIGGQSTDGISQVKLSKVNTDTETKVSASPFIEDSELIPTYEDGIPKVIKQPKRTTKLITPAPIVPKLRRRNSPVEFVFTTELDKLRTSNWKINKIVALVWKNKKYIFHNWEQFNAALGRDRKLAQPLEGYSSKEIMESIERCEQESVKVGYVWNMATVYKKITISNEK